MDFEHLLKEAGDDKTRRALAHFLQQFLNPAFAALPKGEIELLVLNLLEEVGALSAEPSLYELVATLRVTRAKARKLLYLNPLLEALPRVTLGAVAPSRYRLRKAPEAGALSTIEAVVGALNALEQPACFDALLAPFEALIEGQIRAMGLETFQRNHGSE